MIIMQLKIRQGDTRMVKYSSSNIKDLLTKEAQMYVNESMINDINYVIHNPNAKKLVSEYENIILQIEKIESGGIRLQLNVDGKDIEVVPK